ncbi:MAG: outer membrane beta-barrel protein [Bacteroidales bacterium]
MRSSKFIGLIVAVFLFSCYAEAQMISRPSADYLSLTGNKKKEKKKTTVTEKKSSPSTTSEIRAGLGFFTGFPLSDFNKETYTGYGVNAEGEYFLNPALSVGLATGYHSYKYDEISMGKGRYSLIPITLRGAYYFKEGDFHPWAGLTAGIYLSHSKYDSIIEPRSYLDPVTQLFVHKPGEIKPIDENEAVFGVAPIAGIVYKPMDYLWINCNLRYNIIFTENKNKSAMGLHFGFAYVFGI